MDLIDIDRLRSERIGAVPAELIIVPDIVFRIVYDRCVVGSRLEVNKEKIDVIFFDPPRKGCDIEFLKTVIDMKIPKIVYISCNIATAARDIKILEDAGYKLEEATPVDLFSSTLHCESISLLTLK